MGTCPIILSSIKIMDIRSLWEGLRKKKAHTHKETTSPTVSTWCQTKTHVCILLKPSALHKPLVLHRQLRILKQSEDLFTLAA